MSLQCGVIGRISRGPHERQPIPLDGAKNLSEQTMKPNIHPTYNPVLYIDSSTKKEWQSMSTQTSSEKRDIDGVEHQVIRLDISSESHPFFTGKQRLVDSEGRIDRWRRKYAQAAEKKKASETTPAEKADA